MSNYSALIATIDANIKTNGNQEITGAIMNTSLKAMINALSVGYQYIGVATESTIFGTPDQKVFYLAGAGTYGDFVIEAGQLGILKYDTGWSLETISISSGGGAVRYDEAQSLTDEQKQQARRNIEAKGLIYFNEENYSGDVPLVTLADLDALAEGESIEWGYDEDYAPLKAIPWVPTMENDTQYYDGGSFNTLVRGLSVEDETYYEVTFEFAPMEVGGTSKRFLFFDDFVSEQKITRLSVGGGSAEGAVRYDEAQTLTETQKAQARHNINAREFVVVDYSNTDIDVYDITGLEIGETYNLTEENKTFSWMPTELRNILLQEASDAYSGKWLESYSSEDFEYDETIFEIFLNNHYRFSYKKYREDGREIVTRLQSIDDRLNGKANNTEVVKHTPQTLTPTEQAQARQNIDAPNKDGYYEQMGVGYAKSLLGNGAATQEMIDFRASGGTKSIGTGVETIKTIKGNSVVVNQLANADNTSMTDGGITSTYEGNGVWILSGVATSNVARILPDTEITAGHKFLSVADIPVNPNSLTINIGNLNGSAMVYSVSGEPKFKLGTDDVTRSSTCGLTGLEVGVDYTGLKIRHQYFDLTQMFGAGNEPTSLDDPRIKWIQRQGYIPYTEGQILNYKGTGLKTIGVNQWDEEWEVGGYNNETGEKKVTGNCIRSKNKIPVIQNERYWIVAPTNIFWWLLFYDADGNFVQTGFSYPNARFTIPSGAAEMAFYEAGQAYGTTYNHDIQIAIEHSGGATPTTYHPYEEHTLALPITSLKANGVTIFPDGMKSAGTAHDELYGNSLGVITKAVNGIGKVKLKDLDWNYNETYFSEPMFYVAIGNMKNDSIAINTIYQYSSNSLSDLPNKAYKTNNVYLYIRDFDYTDVASFKAHFTDDDYLYFELATPIEYTLDTPINTTAFVEDWGTEMNLPQGKDAQGLPLTTPLNAEIVYAPNVQDEIRNLPKNYISKESMEAILNAFKTAGIVASFTLTFDETSGKYNCTITKQS